MVIIKNNFSGRVSHMCCRWYMRACACVSKSQTILISCKDLTARGCYDDDDDDDDYDGGGGGVTDRSQSIFRR